MAFNKIDKIDKGPVINRSKIQLATSYSPGALFTFEGGKGCFLSVPIRTTLYSSAILPVVRQQIEEQMREFISNWFNVGMNCRAASGPPIYEQQVLDKSAFLDFKKQPSIDIDQFELLEPSQMGYYPDPLNFVCSKCGLLHKYSDTDHFANTVADQEKRVDCSKSYDKRHHWVQIDVVFAHWSGHYEPLYPQYDCQQCGNSEFYLKKSSTGVFSDWHFKCSNNECMATYELTRRDRTTQDILEEKIKQGVTHQPKEMLMLPVSYRASSLHYVQYDRFIPYPDIEIFELLHPSRRSDLVGKLLSIYKYPQKPITDEEIKQSLEEQGVIASFSAYEAMKKTYGSMREAGQKEASEIIQALITKMLIEWELQGWISRRTQAPEELMARVTERQEYARKYDPIRLGIEHSLLADRHLKVLNGTRKATVDLVNPTPDITPKDADTAEGKDFYQKTLNKALERLGIKRFLLIRELDLIQYSFGYTRVSATPTTEQKGLKMPVCLRAFEHVEKGKRPIYVLHQKNEAFYIQLDETIVIKWLAENGTLQGVTFPDELKFGSRYIERYADFGPYLESYKRQDQITARSVCNMTYMLLHTLSHQFIHSVSEYSGLEHGSFGEYLFPADLAFLVYRSGMTPDLGNLSSMWRNFHVKALEQMLSVSKLLCGSGSLCDHRGGACPGCIMLPETICIAGNQLLSRAALKGGPAPRWSQDDTYLQGFFNLTTGG